VLKDVAARGIRVIANAGGVNPRGCADALRALARELGVELRIAVVEGDDVSPQLEALRPSIREMQSGAPLPAKVLTANAYFGAFPIKAALDAGAQVVITGRCVDSAVTLGALMHEFGWAEDDWDRLAQGSLAGHIIECGCQATGGLHTDWDAVPDWAHIGYPVIECRPDGSFTVTKPEGTGGLVSFATVAEQVLYEIHDPRRYLLPDVTCDFSEVTITPAGGQQVEVRGARGLPPGPQYKVCATYMDGFRATAQLTIVGLDAVRKAQRTGESILERTREIFRRAGLPDYSRTLIEVLGSELPNWGPQARHADVREAVLRLAVLHPQRAALEIFAREIAPAGTSWSPGTTGADGRPKPTPSIRQFAFLVDKSRLHPRVELDGQAVDVAVPQPAHGVPPPPPPTDEPAADIEGVEVPLVRLAWARSGDKGDTSNIGVIARRPEWLGLLRAQLTPARVREWLAHRVNGTVTRYDLPGLHAMNFVCTQALDGGGMASLRNDPLGKGMAQILLAMTVRVPAQTFDSV
jgi:hypothetical protein